MTPKKTVSDIIAENFPMFIVGVITVFGIVALTLITLFRPGDSNINFLLIFLGTMTTTILSNKITNDKVKEVHDSVNGKMEKLLGVTKELGHAEGVVEGATVSTVAEVKKLIDPTIVQEVILGALTIFAAIFLVLHL